MFTGLVSAVGEIRAIQATPGGVELTIAAPYDGIEPGESIAVAGACLTVVTREPGWFEVQVVGPSLERTRLGALRPGDRVNLERAVRAGDALGGHLVQGHVDAVGEVRAVHPAADRRLVDIHAPEAVWEVTVPLGSITVEGVSLTVNALPVHGIIQVSLVPHTLERTTLGTLAPGDPVHLEGDVIGKYVRAFMLRGNQGIRESGNQGTTPPDPLIP
jgi:riboflavin synthase